MRLRVICSIPVQFLRLVLGFSAHVVQRAGAVHQGQQLLDLRYVGGRRIPRQRDAVGVYQDVLFDAGTTAIRRVFATSLDTAEGAGEGTVGSRPRPVNEA